MANARIFRVNGAIEEVSPENGKKFTLQELYRLLECDMIEHIVLPQNKMVMIGDEEGRVGQESFNKRATFYYRDCWGIEMPFFQHDQQMAELRNSGQYDFVIDMVRMSAGSGEVWDEPYTMHGDILVCDSKLIG